MSGIRNKSVLAFILILTLCLNFAPVTSGEVDGIRYSSQVAVLVYHHIDDQTSGPVTISSKLFQRQLKNLLRHGYNFISLQQFRGFMSAGAAIPDNAVLVTFDDGYESFYTNAYPVLKKLQIPAVNFVITKDLDAPQASAIPSLSREEIAEIEKEDPNIEFQCHSDRLHDMKDGKPLLSYKMRLKDAFETDQDYELRVTNDTKTSISKLEPLNGEAIDAYAYPFGSYNEKVVGLLKQAGMKYGFTTASGIVTRKTDPMQLPRINAGSPFVRGNSVNNLIQQSLRGGGRAVPQKID